MAEQFVRQTRFACVTRQGECNVIEQTLGGMVDLGWLDVVAGEGGVAYIPTQRGVEFFGLDEMGIAVDSEGSVGYVD